MRPTLIDARDKLVAVLEAGPLNGVDTVYNHEPHREASGPCYVTVEIAGVSPTETRWFVRVYSQLLDSPEDAARTFLLAITSVDDRLGQNNYGPSGWDPGFDDALGCLVSRSTVDVGRETF